MDLDRLLFEAAYQGNLDLLNKLYLQNPHVLDPYTVLSPQRTPLHVAARAGHAAFVTELLYFKPLMGRVPNEQGMCPIHLAAAEGHWEAVSAMLATDRKLGGMVNGEGWTVAHVAAACGKIGVLQGLIDYDRSFVQARTVMEGETIVHTCVSHNQLEALKAIVRLTGDHLLSVQDVSGKTPLQLATASKNVVIANYLLTEAEADMSSVEIIPRKRWTLRSLLSMVDKDQKKIDKQYLADKQNYILIVATVIAGATFQTGIEHARDHRAFRVCNTISFGLAMALFLLLASGGSLKHWVQTRIVLIILWASLFFMALAYGTYIMHKSDQQVSKVGSSFMVVVIIAMLIVLCGHLAMFTGYILNQYVLVKVERMKRRRVQDRAMHTYCQGMVEETCRIYS